MLVVAIIHWDVNKLMDLIFCLLADRQIEFISIIWGNLIFINKLIKIYFYFKNPKKILKLKYRILFIIFFILEF